MLLARAITVDKTVHASKLLWSDPRHLASGQPERAVFGMGKHGLAEGLQLLGRSPLHLLALIRHTPLGCAYFRRPTVCS